MTAKKAFLLGALVGDTIALLFMLLDWIRPFPITANAWVDRTLFKICPFFVLGFTKFVHNWIELITVSLLGNALLYGGVALVILFPYKLFRRATGPTG